MAPPAPPPVAAKIVLRPGLKVRKGDAELTREEGEGNYRLSSLDGATEVCLTGRVSRLTLDGINGEALLDASGLIADEIEFAGPIDGSGTVKLNAPKGNVHFRQEVGGATTVQIHAPGGKVWFHSDKDDNATVLGGAKVRIIAKSVDLAGGMDGGSMVDVTLTRGASLGYAFLTGGAHLRYRKAMPEHPAPVLKAGRIASGGKLVNESRGRGQMITPGLADD